MTPPGFSAAFRPCGKIVDVRDMGIDIIADNQVGLRCFGGKLPAQLFTKKLSQDGYAQLFRGGSSAGCGFNPQTRDLSLNEVLKQVAIVRGNLDDQAVPVK